MTRSGDTLENVSASFSTTYSNKNQLTKNNYMCLTLSGDGLIGKTLNNVKLSMKSNTSGGSGCLIINDSNIIGSHTVDGDNITFSNGVAFNNSSWNGGWSTTYVDVSKDVTISLTGNSLKIYIAATANSLFCQSFTLTFE